MLGDAIASRFENSYGAHAFISLRTTLILDLIRDIWAFVLDSDLRAPSLRNIWRLAEESEVLLALREDFSTPHNSRDGLEEEDWSEEEILHWRDQWVAEDIKTQSQSFDSAVSRVRANLPKMLTSERAQKFDRARKKIIAHYDMRLTKDGPKLHPLSEIGIKYDDPKLFLKEVGPIIWDVVLITTQGTYDLPGYDHRNRLYAADFWARIQGNASVTDIDESFK
ncbi:MAG TPA: hypothetical protein VIJ85_01615 [Rhizomicrobium sp.]